MKLFDDFEAIKFPKENLIYITNHGYLYYIYDPEYIYYAPKYKYWKKCEDAENHKLPVCKYSDVTEKELKKALGGIFPTKETDFARCCYPKQLSPINMLNLLKEDYSSYMSDVDINYFVLKFLNESNITYKSYLKLKELFDNAIALKLKNENVLNQIEELSFAIIGRDILTKEIEISDNPAEWSSYFQIQSVRIIDFSNTNECDNVARMKSPIISIEEDDVYQYISPFLYKYFDDKLEANKKRVADWKVNGFEWHSVPNFYTYSSIKNMLNDIMDTINALSSKRQNEFTDKLNENRPKEDDTELELIIDFYKRFIYRMEYMIKIGEEKGYNLISFEGP